MNKNSKLKTDTLRLVGRIAQSFIVISLCVLISAPINAEENKPKYQSDPAAGLTDKDIPTLMATIKNPSASQSERQIAGERLSALLERSPASAPSVDELQKIYRQGDQETKEVALNLLAKSKSPKALEALQAAANDRTTPERIRGLAVSNLEVHLRDLPAGQRDISILKNYLTDPSDFVKARAAEGLGRFGDHSGLEAAKSIAVKEPQNDAETTSRYEAISALGVIGDPKAVPILEKLKSHPDDFVKMDSIQALNEISYAQLSSNDQKMRMLEQEFKSNEWGPHAYWAMFHLVNILDKKSPGNPDEAFRILRNGAMDPHHRRRSDLLLIFSSRCLESPKYCL